MLKSIRSVTTAMTSKLSPRPVVAVVGTTGVGKSQLAVSLARSLKETDDIRKAVILSADSMQLYKGLDVITNKVTEEEKGGVEHWGLDVVQPGEGGSWELGRWCVLDTYVFTERPDGESARLYPSNYLWRNSLLHPTFPFSTERTIFRSTSRPAGGTCLKSSGYTMDTSRSVPSDTRKHVPGTS